MGNLNLVRNAFAEPVYDVEFVRVEADDRVGASGKLHQLVLRGTEEAPRIERVRQPAYDFASSSRTRGIYLYRARTGCFQAHSVVLPFASAFLYFRLDDDGCAWPETYASIRRTLCRDADVPARNLRTETEPARELHLDALEAQWAVPPLRGTEKQVAYARVVRQRFLEQMPACRDVAPDAFPGLLAGFRLCTSAAHYLDRRNEDMLQLFAPVRLTRQAG